MLPDALRLARALDDELEATGGEAISAHLVEEIAADGTRDLGALAYFLRATRVVLHATAAAHGTMRPGAARRDRPAPRGVLTDLPDARGCAATSDGPLNLVP